MPNYSAYNDAALFDVMRIAGTEKNAAFAELYARYHQRVYAYIVKLIGNKDEAKDIFQEVFVKFMNTTVKEKESITNCGGYLMRSARNLCYNFLRNKKQTIELEDYHLIAQPADRYEQ
jgi:RNA polymerase sigma-70 factor (ECF subfamily)